ncbi:hypothetical protein IFM89_006874 [Coptis chinensis]|uniref:Nicastrin n=1 Tax=Coptis chinensis TaxID=261450 RepID=A0A835LB77_9MAGN|nr:hypothetical protein IFM89_006874 [Coptis chinensis]
MRRWTWGSSLISSAGPALSTSTTLNRAISVRLDNDPIIVHGKLCNSGTKIHLKGFVSQDEMENFFNSVLNDHHFVKKVAGVLVESELKSQLEKRGFSPVEKFPQVKFAPYKNVDYIWNSADSNRAGVICIKNKTFDAFQAAHESLGSNIKILMANKSNSGIPPSSLMSFLRKDSSISGIVLEDFNTAFTNKFYHSRFYDLSNINSSAIVTAASCGLVKDYIGPTSNCPNNYVGVLVGEPSTHHYLTIKAEVCIRSEKKGKSTCVVSTTRYIPAYSTRLKFEYGVWHVLPPDASNVMAKHGRPSMDRELLGCNSASCLHSPACDL